MKKTILKYIKDLRTYITVLLAGTTVWFAVRLILFGMLDMLQCGAVLLILALLDAGVFLLMYLGKKKGKKKLRRRIGKAVGAALGVFLAIGSVGLWTVDSFLNGITVAGTDVVRKDLSVIVPEDSEINSEADLTGEMTMAVYRLVSEEERASLSEGIESGGGTCPQTEEYDSLNEIAEALYEGAVDAAVIDEPSRSVIEDEWPDFSEKTRVIFSISTEQEQESVSREADVTSEPFLVLISGMDTYGSLDRTARSDVNILAAVNPAEAKILLVSIPRDYYVPIMSGGSSIGGRDGSMDKLTHSGLFGAQCTVRTLENFFDLEINYYVKVNFSSVVDIVDAVGGITVESDIAFGQFSEGSNECNGEQALAFVRERYAFEDGDRQRGRNQMKVIEAIVDKLSSPELNYDYAKLFETVQESVEMNFTNEDVKQLIQMEVAERPAWTVETTSVTGADAHDYSYYYGSDLYVMRPDMDSVEAAKEKIAEVMGTGTGNAAEAKTP